MREEVRNLINLGPMPSSESDTSQIESWQTALDQISSPLSDEEAAEMLALFPSSNDTCYGLAWTLIHLVESAPNWPLHEHLQDQQNPWISRLREAAKLT